ncbi:Holliday junction recognition protein [Alligator mississippiensis]|uniref:Holliday junction recognition protein n=1 Tax=Alligator mississippiensis TaxID=8496 RepID=A0A151MDD1_ALLMI|nr:Holliday junction recognition protein [Alligator mississippiensis]
MEDLGERLHRSGARFADALNGIVTKYSYPFEDDVLVSMQTLSCNTPDGPRSWEDISQNYLKRRRKLLKKTTHYQVTTETEQSIAGVKDEEIKSYQEVAGESFIQSSEESQVEDTDTENKADLVSIRRSFENVNLKENNILLANPSEMEMGDKFRVRVDVLVQGDDRNIPKWITVAPREKPESIYLLSPLQGLMETSKSVFDTVAPRCRPLTEKNETGYDSFYEEYQSADEECSWSNVTLADLYPSMVENLSKLINRQTQRKIADYIIRNYKRRGWHPKKPRLNVTMTTSMDLSNTKDEIVVSLSQSPNNQNYETENFNFGFPASPNRTFLVHPSTFLQESRIADIYATIPRMLQNHGSTRNAEKRQQRIFRKLSYNDE